MLRVHEARRVAHERVKDLVQVAQGVSGDLNPEPVASSDMSIAEQPTEGKIQALGQAFDSALDGLKMLREAESAPDVPSPAY